MKNFAAGSVLVPKRCQLKRPFGAASEDYCRAREKAEREKGTSSLNAVECSIEAN
jgi:hypothetical protein